MMWSNLRDGARRFHQTFHYSAVIWIARVQVVLGCVWQVLVSVDLAPILVNPKYVTAWLLFSGIITELGRRSNTIIAPNGQFVPVSRDADAPTIVVAAPAAPVAASPVPTSGLTK
jgi:hypothetical protein